MDALGNQQVTAKADLRKDHPALAESAWIGATLAQAVAEPFSSAGGEDREARRIRSGPAEIRLTSGSSADTGGIQIRFTHAANTA